VDPGAAEIRVLGALIEKQKTTPDGYPLTLNALRLACNQSTNRDPVVEYDEATVRTAAQALGKRGWARLASGHGSRTTKYRHLLDQALRLAPDELAMLGVLMLRGAQTPGELKQRTERMHHFAGLGHVQDALERLVERELVERLERRPGQKEERYRQLLGGDGADAAAATPAQPATTAAEPGSAPSGEGPAPAGPLEQRVSALEGALTDVREDIAALRRELGA
jgi:uncharacterized protein YceH (UPF0502 family)